MKNKNSINFYISPFRLEGRKKCILEYMVVIIDESRKK